MPNKLLIKIILVFSIIIGFIVIFYLYFLCIIAINKSLNQYEDIGSIILFILIRIFITNGMMIYAFWRWCKQKELFFSDVNFLFGLFFLGLTYGKLINLLYLITFYTAEESTLLILLKIRYILIVLTAAPIISIGIDIVLQLKSHQDEKLINKYYSNKSNYLLVSLIIILESILIILALNLIILNVILITFHITSLIWIASTFYIAYRKKYSYQINTLMISIAFFIDLILYISSLLTLSLRRKTIGGYSVLFLILAEIIDLIIIFMIFLGFYMKQKKLLTKN